MDELTREHDPQPLDGMMDVTCSVGKSESGTMAKGMLDFKVSSTNKPPSTMNEEEREFGPQPLIAVMEGWGLESHALVETSDEQLTHKQVQRARSGRKLSLKMMMKVARTLNLAIWSKLDPAKKEKFVPYLHKDLFSYSKGYDPEKQDSNQEISRN